MNASNYDARFSVVAAWALEFSPVNVSVIFMQPRAADFLCVASKSWYFGSLADHVASVRTDYPWRVAQHVLPPEKPPKLWTETFNDLCVYNVENAPALDDGQRILLTQRFLSRLTVDTHARPWDSENNALLVDSLNGYKVREASHADMFTTNPLATHEQYLARALEHFAAFDWKKPMRGAEWGPAPNYAQHDKAVIAGSVARARV